MNTKKRTLFLSILISLVLGLFMESGLAFAASRLGLSYPTSYSAFNRIALGPDGNLWFGDNQNNQIDSYNPSTGNISRYNQTGGAYSMVAGPDGNMWFTNPVTNQIGKITLTGQVTTYNIPTSNSYPMDITVGPDGNLWFTEWGADKVAKITPSGQITEYPVPTTYNKPLAIIAGSDGNLWFSESESGLPSRYSCLTSEASIAKITPSGQITEYPFSGNGCAWGLTTGTDGNIWFTDVSNRLIGNLNPTSGSINEISSLSSSSYYADSATPTQILSGPNGNLWFATTDGTNQIEEYNISSSSLVNSYNPIASPGLPSDTDEMVVGADNNIYLGENYYSNSPIYTGINSSLIYEANINSGNTYKTRFNFEKNSLNNNYFSFFSRSGTQINCTSSVSEASLAKQDTGYVYPLGLVNVCLTNSSNNLNYVTLMFQTSLQPSQVVARDYNSKTGIYMNVPNATILETTLNSQPALELSYLVTPNSPLNSSTTPGLIEDPVGLAQTSTTTSTTTTSSSTSPSVTNTSNLTPDTGYGYPRSSLLYILIGVLSLVLLSFGLRQTIFKKKV